MESRQSESRFGNQPSLKQAMGQNKAEFKLFLLKKIFIIKPIRIVMAYYSQIGAFNDFRKRRSKDKMQETVS
jgi:hypothetical protein